MRRCCTIALSVLLFAGCQRGPQPAGNAAAGAGPAANAAAAAATPAPAGAGRWEIQASGEGTTLALLAAGGETRIRLTCAAGRLLVNVPAFRPIDSEERLSFGSGGAVEALAADPRGDARRGGVSGTGAVPANLAALLGGAVSASYGAQTSGPHPAPPADSVRAFAGACRGGSAPQGQDNAAPAPPAGACLMQGSERLTVRRLRAVGTEPFWGAAIEGRCVTYSHPGDPSGTRLWTRYAATADGGIWTGALGGRPFELRTRRHPGCSDGMSDRDYPIAVELTVEGERRRGCAEPA